MNTKKFFDEYREAWQSDARAAAALPPMTDAEVLRSCRRLQSEKEQTLPLRPVPTRRVHPILRHAASVAIIVAANIALYHMTAEADTTAIDGPSLTDKSLVYNNLRIVLSNHA